MSKFTLIAALILSLLFTACSAPAATQPAETPASTPSLPVKEAASTPNPPDKQVNEWTIEMTQSGGIMGLMRSVEVRSDGSYTVKDERLDKTVTGSLTGSDLQELNELMISTSFSPQKPAGICADCFVYDIQIQMDGNKLNVKLDDTSLPNSGLEPLVALLRGLMDAALK